MTTEQRSELPGYVWLELPGIDVTLPVPENWFVLGIEIAPSEKAQVMGSHLYQISRESIPQRGMFNTGFSIYGFNDFDQNMPGTPEEFARQILRTLPGIQPVTEVAEEILGSLIVCRRRFIQPVEKFATIPSFHGELVSKMMPPTHFSYLAAGSSQLNRAYLGWFETPSAKWKNDKPIAETMINNLSFNK